MRTLMISLDRNILKSTSAVAERMRTYGKTQTLDIIIPSPQKSQLTLAENVQAYGTGGAKWQQFFRLIILGKNLCAQNHYDKISAQEPFLTGLIGLWLRRTPTQLEVQVHGDFFTSYYYRQSSFKNWLYYWLGRLIVVPHADKVRVVGERTKQSVLALGVSINKIITRPVPVDDGAIRAYTPVKNIKNDFPGFAKYFVYVGRLEPEKNVPWLIKTFAQYLRESPGNAVLVIVGEGSQKPIIQEIVTRSECTKNVNFVGWLDNPLDYIKTTDCVLAASLAEGYGLVPMEAAAAGTKIIMTDAGVAGYELKASDRVRIVPVDDQPAFITALKEI